MDRMCANCLVVLPHDAFYDRAKTCKKCLAEQRKAAAAKRKENPCATKEYRSTYNASVKALRSAHKELFEVSKVVYAHLMQTGQDGYITDMMEDALQGSEEVVNAN